MIQYYLNDRTAFVSLTSQKSSHFSVLSGVPQGSLIAPHLFNLFINDIPIFNNGNVSLFADDTAYFIQIPWKNLPSAKKYLIEAVKQLQSFFNDWKISINESKTEFTCFTKSTKMIQKMDSDCINFNGQSFCWKPSVKYLGLVLDRKLLFKNHIDFVIKKASAACFSSLYCLISRKSPVSFDSKVRIYKAVIRPILT